jgi:hypothetical protein
VALELICSLFMQYCSNISAINAFLYQKGNRTQMFNERMNERIGHHILISIWAKPLDINGITNDIRIAY